VGCLPCLSCSGLAALAKFRNIGLWLLLDMSGVVDVVPSAGHKIRTWLRSRRVAPVGAGLLEGDPMKGNSAVQWLQVMELHGGDPAEREAAAAGLRGNIAGDNIVLELIMLLPDERLEVRQAAAWVLQGCTINNAAASRLALYLQDGRPEVRQAATSALRGCTVNDGWMLVTLLQDSRPEMREAVASALQGCTFADRDAARRLGLMLHDSRPPVREAAARALEGTTITDRGTAAL
jgi:hypothetical protein